jgi:beta-lactam-binding protein with PASTA domain
MTLKQARRTLTTAHSALGKVTPKPSRKAAVGRVISQSPKRGKLMHAGARVNIAVGRHR